ncbi:uncharacterized protein LOC6543873 isoform X2 [Drosophila erecta]|uniref:Uncharacterized protein, isoform D n=1 Tax=Drosophila erecta TaxID=7220 RepID=A0A0Q5UHH3_DROER|nr:uncharacterized protein LOC6543873 isoform X2 [Drosophila erecta]KQS43335.1 uncharacterized protein Dere_GG14400, isoform D [Drosophila erecta]
MEPTSSSSVAELAQNSGDVELDEDKLAEHQEYAEALSMSGESRKRKRWTRRSCCTRQILSAGAIFIALLLIIGAIYMHLRQKHHLGRLHIILKDRDRVEVLDENFPVATAAAVGECAARTLVQSLSSAWYSVSFISGLHCWDGGFLCLLCFFLSQLTDKNCHRMSQQMSAFRNYSDYK